MEGFWQEAEIGGFLEEVANKGLKRPKLFPGNSHRKGGSDEEDVIS